MMKRLSILLLLSVPLFAEPPAVPRPVIDAITPAVGPSSGGTTVSITGTSLSLPPGFACILPCPTKVTFGDATAELLQETNTLVVVKTPPHSVGGVDVTLTTGDGRVATAPNGFLYTENSEAQYERILLPIYLEAPVFGLNGSQWETQFWLRNSGSFSVTLAPWPCPPGALCLPVVPLTFTLNQGQTLLNLPKIPQSNPGRVLFASRETARNLSATLRLYEKSRAAVDAGTDIPIVRESELRTDVTNLHAVPLDGHFRLMLRVYDLVNTQSRFRVSVFPQTEGADVTTPISTLTLDATGAESEAFRMHPAYAEYGRLTDLLLLPTLLPSQLRIQIEPLTAGSRYWAFVSVTNNDTQRVTLITPQ